MANEPFVWGAAGERLTPSEVKQKRRIAEALLAQAGDTSPVGHWTVALNRALQGYLGGRANYKASKSEREGTEAARAKYESVIGGASPVAAALAGGGSTAPQGGGSSSYEMNGNVIRDGIIETANALGMNPEDLATIISYETAGTFDPTKRGPTTQWGQHRGLIQFGEPQAEQYGVNWDDPISSQLGKDGAIYKYFMQNGWQPGMGMLDAYSIVNAGAPGRYNASDANNGGAPGTVADKVSRQMAAHRKKAVSLLGGGGYQPSVAPSGPSSREIAALLSDPWMAEAYGPQIGAIMQQAQAQENAAYESALKQNDPMYQAQLEAAQLANAQARQPQQPKPIEVGGVLLDPVTMQPIFDSREAPKPPSSIQEYEYYANAAVARGEQPMPFEQFQAAMARAGSGAASGVGTIPAGYQAITDPLTGQITGLQPIPGGPAELEAEKGAAALEAREANKANAAAIVLQDIDKAIENTSAWTSGFGGSILGAIPGSGANDLRATIDTVKANIGFDRLQQMRDASPTGGALGGIAVQELNMLQAVLGSLDQSQSPEQLKKNLQRLREVYEPIAKKAAAYPNAGDFGFGGGDVESKDTTSGAAKITRKADYDSLPSGATFIAPDGTTRRKP